MPKEISGFEERMKNAIMKLYNRKVIVVCKIMEQKICTTSSILHINLCLEHNGDGHPCDF